MWSNSHLSNLCTSGFKICLLIHYFIYLWSKFWSKYYYGETDAEVKRLTQSHFLPKEASTMLGARNKEINKIIHACLCPCPLCWYLASTKIHIPNKQVWKEFSSDCPGSFFPSRPLLCWTESCTWNLIRYFSGKPNKAWSSLVLGFSSPFIR